MKSRISVVGDCVQDIFILSDAKITKQKNKNSINSEMLSFSYRDKLNIEELNYDLGGSACNAAVAMRDLNLKTSMVSMLGGDIYSKSVRAQLKKKKVETSFLVSERGLDIGISFVLLGPDRDRTILTYRASNDFSKIKTKKLFRSSGAYYIAGINKHSRGLVMPILKDAQKNGKDIFINPSRYQIDYDRKNLLEVLKNSKIAVMNVEEAHDIMGLKTKNNIREVLSGLKKIGIEIVVVTDGKRGAYAYDGKEAYKSGIMKIKRVDATGAGDSFAGTFVASWKNGFSLQESLRSATVNAGSVISVYGAQKGLLGWKKILSKRGLVKINKVNI